MLTLGWLTREGPFISAEMRIWKVYPMARATEEGISAGAGLRLEW
jgi:hypothetical protein